METAIGQNFARLKEDLEKNGPQYNVWQAVYLGEIITKKMNPDRNEYILDQKGMKFRPHESYGYPPTDLRSITISDNEIEYILNFLGLYGVNSAIPRCYHEQVALQQSIFGKNEVPLQNFLDIFNNRFYWLYYQSWKKYKYYYYFHEGSTNKVSQRINSFIGRGPNFAKKESRISHYTLLKFSGFLSNRVRNKAGLMIILNHLFPFIKMKVREFVPKWVKFSETPELGSGEGMVLGVNTFIGESALDYMSRICIEIGPISFEEYLTFTPNSENSEKLKELLELYLNDGLEYDVKIIVKADTIKTIDWKDTRQKLGSSVWLGKPKEESSEVYYTYEDYTQAN
ncbi:MAG: type VI secretion system baseplate subunit TssG [Ignavibacteriae bacterium]|nr:type VI secretion system baseplate subunit TssG [Ignavibacteriota bacterium]NOG96798.1 type VI secretion system baseplate subunit TssG [Ignavibacteriota bacterium]